MAARQQTLDMLCAQLFCLALNYNPNNQTQIMQKTLNMTTLKHYK